MDVELSMILTSQHRKKELKRFVDSLNNQEGIDFYKIQLVFIDQGNNISSFDSLDSRIDFVYRKVNPCSLSRARNIGIAAVRGIFICFPDDDCWLQPTTLSQVLTLLHNGCDGVVIKVTDEKGSLLCKSPSKSQYITKYNHCAACSISIFLKFYDNLFFNEDIGVGSKYGIISGEETDYLIRFYQRNKGNIFYNKDIIIHHPSLNVKSYDELLAKKYGYGKGWGYIMKIHEYPLGIVFVSFIRPIFGIILYSVLGKLKKVKLSFQVLKGRYAGYTFKLKS